MPVGCELVFEGGIIENGTIDLNGCKLAGMIGQESEYLPNVTCSNWAVGQIEYRNGKICYWNGTEWRVMGDTSSFDSYTKQEINNLLKIIILSLKLIINKKLIIYLIDMLLMIHLITLKKK